MQVELLKVPIDEVNPFDATHFESGYWPGFKGLDDYDTDEHYRGINYARQLVKEGARLRPIACMPMERSPFRFIYPHKRYHRLDGFKRYWAQALEGVKEIEILLIQHWYPGTQENHPMTIIDGEILVPGSQNVIGLTSGKIVIS